MEVAAVTNRNLCKEDFLKRIEKLYVGGADKIILREKDLNDDEYFVLAEKCFEICGGRLYVNSRIEIAKALGIKNIHLPLRLFTEKDSFFRQTGVSVHSAAEALSAEKAGADYIIGGHVFETDCKKGLAPRGIGFITETAAAVNIPVYAIGGISPDNAPLLKNSGIQGVCLMSTLMNCENPEDIISRLKNL
ncbi:MAG: thiamine phosphate synthase [Clostridiales bacterium]|nr:thiamine phosphate synthase [Clostridiales bacterium]